MKKKQAIIAVILVLVTVVSLILAVSSYSKYRNTVAAVEDRYLLCCKEARRLLLEYQGTGDETKYDSMVSKIGNLYILSTIEGIDVRLSNSSDVHTLVNACHWLLIAHKEECVVYLDLLGEAFSYIENDNIAMYELKLRSFRNSVDEALR